MSRDARAIAYAGVPAARADAEIDPYWQQLTASNPGLLPGSFLPPAMPGSHAPWRRVGAGLLVALLVTATEGGVCLTYGPDELFRLLRSGR